jgi:ubiquinone/menaquinone biosynthesis C-methylase UbiE
MTASDAAFTGLIPEYYDQYLGPLIFESYSTELARRVQVPSHATVLEIAAGTGIATRQLRNALTKDVRIFVTDLNPDMLELAKRKFDTQANLVFQSADATKLAYADASFDAVVCQFSLMFFPDKPAALQEVARVLKPGGTFVFSLWDSYAHNHLVQTVNDTLAHLFPENRPTFFDTPYGYHNIDEVKTMLDETGFGDVEISVLTRMSRSETARQVALGYILGTPVCLQIAERGAPLGEVVNVVENAIRKFYGSSSICAKMQALVFKAHWKTEI